MTQDSCWLESDQEKLIILSPARAYLARGNGCGFSSLPLELRAQNQNERVFWMNANATVFFELTGSHRPALWEQGGSTGKSGQAIVIAGPNGEKLRPFFVNSSGHLECGSHALLPLDDYGHVVEVDWHSGEVEGCKGPMQVYRIRIQQIIHKDIEEGVAITDVIFDQSGVAPDVEAYRDLPHLVDAIREAVAKANCYRCRKTFYALPRR